MGNIVTNTKQLTITLMFPTYLKEEVDAVNAVKKNKLKVV
jgi:hypothetical protein